jgi:hypothetical protein
VPLRHFVLQRGGDARQPWITFTLFICEFGFIGWPVKRLVGNIMTLDMAAPKLEFRSAFDFVGLNVVPFKPVGILHNAIRKDIVDKDNGVLVEHGAPVPILDYMADVGFSGVQERFLKKLHTDHFKIEEPDPKKLQLDTDFALALSLMQKVKPGMQPGELCGGLHKRIKTEADICCGVLEQVPFQLIEDVITSPGDRKVFKSWGKETKQNTEKFNTLSAKVVRAIKLQYPKWNPSQGEVYSKAHRQKIGTAANAARWWTKILGDPTFLDEWKPAGSKVFVDNREGRFRVAYKGGEPNSFSWTERGNHEAVNLSLRCLWDWRREDTGAEMPAALVQALEQMPAA